MRAQWVSYGRPTGEALRAEIASAKGDEPLRPVTVVVPSNHVGVAARRLLASGAVGPVCGRGEGVAAVTFVTVHRLAEVLGSARLAGSGRRPVSTPVIAASLRWALGEDPGVFEAVASHPATETALVAAYRELRDASPGAVDALAATSRRAADVVRLHRQAHARLRPAWYDEEDLMTGAAGELHAGGGADLGSVIVYLPQRLSRHATELLRAARGVTEVSVLAGAVGDPHADAEVVVSLARLGATEVHRAVVPGGTLPPGPVRFITTSDADDEVRTAVRAVVDAARGGTPLDRIAILHAGAEPYARLVHEQLSAAEIRANGAAVVPLAGRVAGRALLGLLALPTARFRRQDVFAWMAAAPLLYEGRPAPVNAWERISREAGVVAGRADWDLRLDRLADELQREAVEIAADPDAGSASQADRRRELAARARSLRGFVLGLIDDLDGVATRPRRWADHARWTRRHLQRLLGGDRARSEWPTAERVAAERVELAIDRLGALDGVEGPVDLDVFARTLELELDADLGRVGRFGEGVLVGPVSMGVGLDLDLLIVLGMVEGTFPATLRDDSVLPDLEREAAAGELDLRRNHVERQHRWLLAALAGASRRLLCIPRGDLRRSSERVPSRWAVDLASTAAGERLSSGDLLERAEHVASFDAGLRELRFAATAQEHRLRSLLAGPAAVHEMAGAHGMAGAPVITARRSTGFTRFDGNLAGFDVPIRPETSATRLERWVGCPFAYLMYDLLGIQAVDNPEDELEMTPMIKGNLVHAVLEQFALEVLARPADEQPGPDDPWTTHDRLRMAEIVAEIGADYEARGLTGRDLFWRRDQRRILNDLMRFLDEDDAWRRGRRATLVAAELAFNDVEFPIPGGRMVRFRGKADRVDADDEGNLFVLDYKTGGTTGYTTLSEEDPDAGGHKLQLPIYGIAARAQHGKPDATVEAAYWFISARGGFARKGYPVTEDVLVRVGARLGVIVDGIAGGMFPNYPTTISSSRRVDCPYCDPDGLGVTELQRAWERKRTDPAVALYAGLVTAGA